MVTGNLKDYHQDDIIFMIERIRDGEQSASVQDLKAILSEVNNRQLGNEYANLVSELLRQRIALGDFVVRQANDGQEMEQTRAIPVVQQQEEQPEQPETEAPLRRVTRQEERPVRRQPKAEEPAPRRQPKAEEADCIMPAYTGSEPYPVLNFMVTFAKTLGWVLYALITLGGMAASALLLRNDVPVMISGMILSVGVGVVFLLVFYVWAERIKLMLDIERHLRK